MNLQNPRPAVSAAIEVLEDGGVVVFPTDTLYGLLANALDPRAVEKVFAIKSRSHSKPLPIIARNLMWIEELAYITPRQRPILEKIWPGTITTVLHRKRIIPDIITAGNLTVAIRVPDSPLLDELLAKYGYPLTATSASISGEHSPQRIENIISMFRDSPMKPDLVIDAGTLAPSEPSTLLDLTGSHPKILRVGATNPQQLMELLKM